MKLSYSKSFFLGQLLIEDILKKKCTKHYKNCFKKIKFVRIKPTKKIGPKTNYIYKKNKHFTIKIIAT